MITETQRRTLMALAGVTQEEVDRSTEFLAWVVAVGYDLAAAISMTSSLLARGRFSGEGFRPNPTADPTPPSFAKSLAPLPEWLKDTQDLIDGVKGKR